MTLYGTCVKTSHRHAQDRDEAKAIWDRFKGDRLLYQLRVAAWNPLTEGVAELWIVVGVVMDPPR
jgi:hypothetical protein